MKDHGNRWENAACDYQWLIDWRYLQQDHRWFVGGYSNVAMNVLDRYLETQSDALAIIDQRGGRQETHTYRELYWASAGLARWWRDQGIAPGDRIVVVGRPTVDGLIAWLAAARLGAVVVRTSAGWDGDLHNRMRTAEAKWMVVGEQSTADQITRIGSEQDPEFDLLCSDGVRVSKTSRHRRMSDVLQGSRGLLDPVPVEANAVGVLLYGDDAQPYAYAGIGALIGWGDSLRQLLDLKRREPVGVVSDFGGLADLLPLTLALLSCGCTVRWLDVPDQDGRGGILSTVPKLIVDSSRQWQAVTAVQSVDRLMIVGPRGRLGRFQRRDGVFQVEVDMACGLYRLLDSPLSVDLHENPARDRSHNQRVRRESALSGGERLEFGSWPQQVRNIAGAVDVARTVGASGNEILWVRVEGDADSVQQLIGLTPALESDSTSRLVCVSSFPETEEGRVVLSILGSVGRGESRIPLSGLRNPEVVESLVRAWAAIPAPGLSTSGWLSLQRPE